MFQEHATYKMPPIQQHQLKKTLMSQSSDKVRDRKSVQMHAIFALGKLIEIFKRKFKILQN